MLNATALYEPLIPKNEYYDKKSKLSPEEYKAQLKTTATLYVGRPRSSGNISKNTTEEAIYELFSKCGEIKMIKLGLNRKKKVFCGFCFVE